MCDQGDGENRKVGGLECWSTELLLISKDSYLNSEMANVSIGVAGRTFVEIMMMVDDVKSGNGIVQRVDKLWGIVSLSSRYTELSSYQPVKD